MIRIQPGQPRTGASGRVLTKNPDAESRCAACNLVGKVITFFLIVGAIRAASVFLGTA